jgi:RNA binding exosome subunit
MVELTEQEERVVEAMKTLKATADDRLVKRVAREKAAGYYLIQV